MEVTTSDSYQKALDSFQQEAWHGVYGRYGEIVGREVRHWAACYTALCARIGRSLSFQHAYPHYGME